MSNVYRASALVLLALAGTAMADGPTAEEAGLRLKALTTPPPGMSFAPQSEVNQLVFAVRSPSDGGTSRGTGGRSRTIKNGVFPTYPPEQAVTYPIAVNALAYGYIMFGDGIGDQNGQPLGNFDVQIVFFDDYDGGVAPPFGSNVLGTFRANNITPNWGFIEWFQAPLTLTAPINFPDQNWAYEYQIFETGSNNLWGTTRNTTAATSADQIVPCAKGPGNDYAVGGGNQFYQGNNPVNQGTPTYADLVAGNIGTAANQRNIYLKLQADIPAPPPPAFVNFFADRLPAADATIDCANGVAVRNVEILPASVTWVKFQLASDASVAAQSYCDITVADVGLIVDATMGVYNQDGVLQASDDDSAEGLGALCTFGHGRRQAIGDSIQGDGRHGDLVAGTYFVAASGFGAVYAESGFTVNAADVLDAGFVDISINHNTGASPCPLPAPVAPVFTDVGLLPAGVTSTSVAEVGFGTLQWLTFTTDYAIDSSDPTKFLDITTAGSNAAVVDSEIGVYDSLGNLVGNNDDGCDDFVNSPLSVISFGDASANPRPALGSCQGTGQTGATLPAGTYYLAVALFNCDFQATGWQARSDSGSNLTVNVNFRTPAGCRADFNGDGNVDPDDLGDYINCYFSETVVLGSCPAADFDGGGDANPDDLGDFINLYFQVTGGGSCL